MITAGVYIHWDLLVHYMDVSVMFDIALKVRPVSELTWQHENR